MHRNLRRSRQHQERQIDKGELIKLQLDNLARIKNLASHEELEIAAINQLLHKQAEKEGEDLEEIEALLNSLDEIDFYNKSTHQRITPGIERVLSYFTDSLPIHPPSKRLSHN